MPIRRVRDVLTEQVGAFVEAEALEETGEVEPGIRLGELGNALERHVPSLTFLWGQNYWASEQGPTILEQVFSVSNRSRCPLQAQRSEPLARGPAKPLG